MQDDIHINLPYEKYFDSKILLTIKKELEKYPELVFYCMYSKERGPRSSILFEKTIESKLNVYVLIGGFTNWCNSIKNSEKMKNLTEDFNIDNWCESNNKLIWKKDLSPFILK